MSLIKAAWDFLGTPRIWIVILFAVVITDSVSGPTIRGTILVFMCLVCFYLERIASAVEKKAAKPSNAPELTRVAKATSE